MQKKHILLLFLIITIAAVFRFTGLNWDQGAHLHPDERFLTMVATSLKWPASLAEYFDTDRSPLNPHNQGFTFYVYGTWPVVLVKWAAETLGRGGYDQLTMVGRVLSVIFDLGTTILVFLIAKQLTKHQAPSTKLQTSTNYQVPNHKLIGSLKFRIWKLFGIWDLGFGIFPYLAMFLYASAVLPIQLSHFFTADPFAVLFASLSLYLLIRGELGASLGLSFALALAAKISSILLLPMIVLAFFTAWPWRYPDQTSLSQKRWEVVKQGFWFILALFITFRLTYPYLFDGLMINPKVLANWRELASFDNPQTHFPPALQWIGVKPWQPLLDLVVWGLGLPYGILILLAVGWPAVALIKRKKFDGVTLLMFWVLVVFFYQSLRFPKPMRYFIPLYPALAVLASIFLVRIYKFFKFLTSCFSHSLIRLFAYSFIGLLLIWPLAFTSIYRRPHTRVAASQWVYTNIPPGKTIAWEHWDDPLPLSINGASSLIYQLLELPVFDADTPEKWQKINSRLAQADYLILSSNRAYGAIMRAGSRFPQTTTYYRQLFSEQLGFVKVAEFTSRPTIVLPWLKLCLRPPWSSYGDIAPPPKDCRPNGITIIDDYADETFTVYDHPKVIIFQKI